GPLKGYYYAMHPYPHRALLLVVGEFLARVDYRLQFMSTTGGSFSAKVYLSPVINNAVGTFTLSP
ncbi:MAG: hypothetical protein U1E27_07850, partial [Kiritimatiellia bacterium]|nr:hypothetical protein [Kiritimatiellia bacterium]